MELYPYQKRVAKLLRTGKSVILQAPTGSGKTIAAIWPYLESWDRQATDFPRKCIYVVPMRVLAVCRRTQIMYISIRIYRHCA
ncbi:MAG: DEAD/DEAH box helicase [Chloroflexi bacterium]|nr:DEAD/DEAH box helicase [Chloroflexota bacterium]